MTLVYTIQQPMGHTGDDAAHKIPHIMKMHWRNQLKISVLTPSIDFDIKRQMLQWSYAPLDVFIQNKQAYKLIKLGVCGSSIIETVTRFNFVNKFLNPRQHWGRVLDIVNVSTCVCISGNFHSETPQSQLFSITASWYETNYIQTGLTSI